MQQIVSQLCEPNFRRSSLWNVLPSGKEKAGKRGAVSWSSIRLLPATCSEAQPMCETRNQLSCSLLEKTDPRPLSGQTGTQPRGDQGMGGEKGPEKQSGEIGHSPTRANGTEAGTLGPDARCSRAQPLGPRQSEQHHWGAELQRDQHPQSERRSRRLRHHLLLFQSREIGDHSCFMCNARRSEDASCLSGGAVFTTRNTRVIPSVTRAGRRSLHKLQLHGKVCDEQNASKSLRLLMVLRPRAPVRTRDCIYGAHVLPLLKPACPGPTCCHYLSPHAREDASNSEKPVRSHCLDGHEQDSDGQASRCCALLCSPTRWLLSCVHCAEPLRPDLHHPNLSSIPGACSLHSRRSGCSVRQTVFPA
uniref:Uncharacterized protein n=1 Tax=Rangifer tarandus platyrhynchus TaxID=3082113 RepID=A0ACB0FEQ0_RANTA|nr:unnamed protein product [Rangifer tarandus platyrhynchus]